MITEEQALGQILGTVQALPSRRVPIAEAVGRFVAEDCIARTPLPNFDNSAMDGYAVIAADCRPGTPLQVTGEQPAGLDRQLEISSGQAIRIFTGAPLPRGADAVVMQEDVQTNDPAPAGDGSVRTAERPGIYEIVVNTDVSAGEFVRRRGCDVAPGQKILSKGERVRAVGIGALAAQGFADVAIGSQPTVAIISTGSELVQPGTPLKAGQIYDSNSELLRALVTGCGASVGSVERCADEERPLLATLERAGQGELMIISGGVSVGQHDLVKAALAQLGATLDIWRVAIKPGKPFLFGRLGDCHIFGLPGNPVSSFVTFLKFVRPAILKMMGAADAELALPLAAARLTEDVSGDPKRPHYIRGKLAGAEFTPIGRQESHAVFGLSRSIALLRVAAGAAHKAGDLVEVELWD